MMEENKVMFADGTIYDCPYLATAHMYGKLYVTLAGVTFPEAAMIFSNPEKTQTIRYGNYILEGYTVCDVIINDEAGFKAQLGLRTVTVVNE